MLVANEMASGTERAHHARRQLALSSSKHDIEAARSKTSVSHDMHKGGTAALVSAALTGSSEVSADKKRKFVLSIANKTFIEKNVQRLQPAVEGVVGRSAACVAGAAEMDPASRVVAWHRIHAEV